MTWLLLLVVLLRVLLSLLLRERASDATSNRPLLLLLLPAAEVAMGLRAGCCAEVSAAAAAASAVVAAVPCCSWRWEADRCMATAERGPTPAVAAARCGLCGSTCASSPWWSWPLHGALPATSAVLALSAAAMLGRELPDGVGAAGAGGGDAGGVRLQRAFVSGVPGCGSAAGLCWGGGSGGCPSPACCCVAAASSMADSEQMISVRSVWHWQADTYALI